MSGLTVPWCHFEAHLQNQTLHAQPPSCGPAAGFGAAGLWSESELSQLNSAPPPATQPGTTHAYNFSNKNMLLTNFEKNMKLFSSITNLCDYII